MRYLVVILCALIFLFNSRVTQAVFCNQRSVCWYRGNTHNHMQSMSPTTYRDKYKNAGYDFIAGYDHDTGVSCATQEGYSVSGFLFLCGSELSKYSHVLAFATNNLVTSYSSLQGAITGTINAGGVPIKNHPQDPVYSASQLIALTGLNHFEVFNGGRPSQTAASEKLWDDILSNANGRKFFGVASDDDHDGSPFQVGWVMVQAPSLTKDSIRDNFRNGNFYASTGVYLNDYQVDKSARIVKVESQNGNTITFIGNNGSTLRTVTGSPATATYQVTGSEKYIRAKITNSSGKAAWTQPIYVNEFSGSPPPTPKPGDTDNNGMINAADMKEILIGWLSSISRLDVNHDGKVNLFDAAFVVKNWTL